MLAFLHIRNYALIQELEIEFYPGFSIITGETGAGKSILLGALSLLLGNRADSSVLNKGDKKCIVEGGFNIKPYKIRGFFQEHDIDYEDQTLIRREITPGGKSRARDALLIQPNESPQESARWCSTCRNGCE